MRLSKIQRLLLVAAATGVVHAQDPAPQPESVLFDEIPKVETASLYTQTLQEAPANVTVIPASEIRRYGYRTLGEALASVRGFYAGSDGVSGYLGVRGFCLPGDFNTRVLVMVNGHYMTDNVYAAMYMFGQDFGIDMDLVERIEVVRGPSSAIYGSNGVFATINIFTRSPADAPRGAATLEVGSFGEKKAGVSAAVYLGGGANLLLSLSGFDTAGRTLDSPEYGRVGQFGAEHGYHAFAQLTKGNWSFTANLSDRRILAPFGWYLSDYGDPGTSNRDGRSYFESSWTKPVGQASTLRWRLYYDQFRYYGRFDFTAPGEPVVDERDYANGDWVGTQLTFQTPVRRIGTLSVGAQFDADLRNLQQNYLVGVPGYVLDISEHARSVGFFAEQQWNVSRRWTLFLGARVDDSQPGDPFLSPRAGAVFRTGERSAYKFLYGRAFRNPSTFERRWEPNPQLHQEKMQTWEVVRERSLGRRLDLVATGYYYRLAGLIEGVPLDDAVLQYRNVRDSRALGAELELRARLGWFETAGSFSRQSVRYRDAGRLPNSPATLVQLRAAASLFRDHATASLSGRYLSRRIDAYGGTVGGAPVADFTFTTKRLHRDFDIQFGVRNLLDRRYYDPLSQEHLLTALERPGRSAFLKLIWHYGQ